MKIVILAAGIGKRMDCITKIIPKPLLPINGIAIIDNTLLNISKLGFSEVTIVVNHLSNLITEYCGTGKKYNINIKYVFQDIPNGTGFAVKQAIENSQDDIMIIGGDTLFTLDHFKMAINEFSSDKVDGFLLLKKISHDTISRTSSVKVNEKCIITSFIEKPKLDEIKGDIGAALLHIYNQTFCRYLNDISLSERGEYELTEATIKMIKDKKIIKGKLMVTPLDLTNVNDLLIHNFDYIKNILKNKG